MDELERWRGEMERRFAEAFPGGDHVGHCRYHELMIEDIAARKRLRQAVVEKTIGGLVWAMIVGFAIMSWDWLVAAVKRAIH
ncbi:MAG TPA: hypothetical protein VFV90_10880 [Usitatibacter sp.]|nr:hypothetical protein [Usitatibacter sp.]